MAVPVREEFGGFTAAEAAELRRRYENGESIRVLARSAHVRDSRIRAALAGAGGTMRSGEGWEKRRRKLVPTQVEEIITRYMRGEGQREIARALDVSQATVRYHLRKAGVGID